MDPLAHTLVGASLAETGLRHKSLYATATLVVAANLPDIDGVCTAWGPDASLAHRRGLTHGVLALVLLPLLLALLVHAYGRWALRRRAARGLSPPDTVVSFPWLLALAALGVWSHPLLDWMNTYGVRLLMPFEGRWFYGDTLFIIDPVVWLLAGAAVVFARGRTKLAAAGWLLLLLAATVIIVVPKLAPPLAKMAWCVGAGLLVYLRIRGTPPHPRATALVCLSLLTMYVGTMVVGTARARARADAYFSAQSLDATQLVVSPLPASPLFREVIARIGSTYHFVRVPAFGSAPPEPSGEPMPVGDETPEVRAALAAPGVRGMVNWLRVPAYRQEPIPGGTRVTLLDVRYSRTRAGGIGRAEVDLDHEGQVIRTRP